MNDTAEVTYRKRMVRVLEHIARHPDDDLALDALADVAAFSKFHFHRQFRAYFGLSLHRYVRLSRVRQAALSLGLRADMSVTEIALSAGFQSPDTFARAFREEFGCTPSAFRKAPDWSAWHAAIEPHDNARKLTTMVEYRLEDVSIVELDEIPILTMRHDGPVEAIQSTVARFIAWRKSARLSPERSRTFTLYHGDPYCDGIPTRIDLACSAPASMPSDEAVEEGVIPAGRYARLLVRGPHDDLEHPANWLYLEWLPRSGEEPRDFPLLCERSKIGVQYAPHEMVTELLLPLA